jgi:hypothetical protein
LPALAPTTTAVTFGQHAAGILAQVGFHTLPALAGYELAAEIQKNEK